MVRVCALLSLAVSLSIIAAAAAVPTTTVPAPAASVVAPGVSVATPPTPAHFFLSSVAGHQLSPDNLTIGEEVEAAVMELLDSFWVRFTNGTFDKVLADFKAGKFDFAIPTQAQAAAEIDKQAKLEKMKLPAIYELLRQFKAGELDAFLATAKAGTLDQFLAAVGAKLTEVLTSSS